MNYEQVFAKMPEEARHMVERQPWVQEALRRGLPLHAALTDADELARLLPLLSRAERCALELIVRGLGSEPFAPAALEQRLHGAMAGAAVRVGLAGLRARGIVAAFRKAWGDRLYALPEDGFAVWQAHLLPPLPLAEGGPEHAAQPQPELEPLELPAGANPRGMAQQLFHLLAACDRLALPLTAKGAPHQKQLAKLAERCALPAEPLAGCGLSHAFPDACGIGLAVLLDAAMRLGLLGRAAGRLVLRPAALGAWMARPYAQQMGRLYRLWRELQAPQPVWQQHAIALLERAGGAGWQPAAALAGWLAAQAAEPGADEAELVRGVRERWLVPLHALGWLELAQDSAGGLWYRWKQGLEPTAAQAICPPSTPPLPPPSGSGPYPPLTEPSTASPAPLPPVQPPPASAFAPAPAADDGPADAACRLYVQPDFELLLPPGVPLSVEWQVAAVAELQHSDELRVYRLTKTAFHSACERGASAPAVLALLSRWNRSGPQLPEAVERALREWDEQYGKVRFEEVTLLVCDSPEVAAAVAASERCRPYLGEAVGDRHFIVQRSAGAALHKQLRQMGWTPGTAAPEPPAGANLTGELAEAEPLDGLVYRRDTAALYEVDGRFEQPAELYPQLPDTPASWLKEYRSYHGSTRKELIRRAIEWQSWLKLRKSGEERLIAPCALVESRDGWLLVGRADEGEVRLDGEEWAELQLVLPGINDSADARQHPLFALWT